MHHRVLTVPNALSVLRLSWFRSSLPAVGGACHGWAVAVLMFSGFSDWADGKIAGWLPTSRLGSGNSSTRCRPDLHADGPPRACRPRRGAVVVGRELIRRDAVLAATLPVLRSRGLTALPVTYIGKAATFALMSGLPFVLLGQWDALWSRVILACGWAFLIWGLALYLWSAVLYLSRWGWWCASCRGRRSRWATQECAGRLPPRGRSQRPRGGRADTDSGAVAAAFAAVRPSGSWLRGGRRAPREARRAAGAGVDVACWPRCRGRRVRRRAAQAQSVRRPPGRLSRCCPAAFGRQQPPPMTSPRGATRWPPSGRRAAQPARGRRARSAVVGQPG